MKKMFLLGAVAACGFAVSAAAPFDVVALVDSLDFAHVYDIETATGTVQTLEHVLLTHPTTVLWRDKGGSLMRYPSAEEASPVGESPLDKRKLPRLSVYGNLRLERPEPDAFGIVREECARRGLVYGIHTTWEENHWLAYTESNWNVAHPQYMCRTRRGGPRLATASLAWPEVRAHKMRLVDERLALKPQVVFLDLHRNGGWSPRMEYVKPVIDRWRAKYGCEPPSDARDPRWLALVGEDVMSYLRAFAAKCHAAGVEFHLGFKRLDLKDDYLWRMMAVGWKELAADGTLDAVVLMDVDYDPKRAYESTREILSYAKAHCGKARLYFHCSTYAMPNGIPGYVKATGQKALDVARELLRIAQETGCAGAYLECVDYRNYSPGICDALGATQPVDCSLAVPDPLVKSVSIAIEEVKSVTNATPRSYSVDFANDAQYRAASAQRHFEKKTEDGKSFVRMGLNGKTAFHGGIRSAAPFAVTPQKLYRLRFWGRAPKGCGMVYLRLLDEKGKNVSDQVLCPKDWTYTPYNIAVYRKCSNAPSKWHEEEMRVLIPDGVHQVLPILATWVDGKAEWYDCRDLVFEEMPRQTVREKIVFNRRETDGDGALVLTSDAASLRVRASVTTDDAGVARIKADVADTSASPKPRALDVSISWRHDLSGWAWHKNWRTDVLVEKNALLSNSRDVTGLAVGIYPFTAVSKDGKGVALGTCLDDPAFEHGTVTRDGVCSRRALGLLKRGNVGASAELMWLVYSFDGKWGFRSAAKKYYASQARKFPSVVPAGTKEGTRSYLGVMASQLPENTEDFGLAFYIPNGGKNERLLARKKGMCVHPYILAWQMPTHHFKDYGDMPPMEDRIAELKSWLPITNEKGHRNFSSKSDLAKLVLGSMPMQADGTHPLSLEWYDGVVHYWRLNVDPRLPKPSAASHFFDVVAGWGMDTIDGVYLDNVYIQNFNNVRPDHLAVMTEPLVYDADTAQPCAHAMQHQVAFVKALGDWLHPLGKRVTGNVFPNGAYRFNATLIDVFGSETGFWGHGADRSEKLRKFNRDENACEERFFAYRRPVSDMLQDGNWTTPTPAITAEGIAGYVEHHLFYGFYPGVVTIGGEDFPGYRGWKRYFGKARQCERDRALFKRAVPLIRRLNVAGWQPETHLRSANPKLFVERYGGAGDCQECLFTVRNATEKTIETTLTLDPEWKGKIKTLAPLWHGNIDNPCHDGNFTVRVEPWHTEVYLCR